MTTAKREVLRIDGRSKRWKHDAKELASLLGADVIFPSYASYGCFLRVRDCCGQRTFQKGYTRYDFDGKSGTIRRLRDEFVIECPFMELIQ